MIRTVITVYEPHSRSRLKSLLRHFPEIQLIGETGDGKNAPHVIDSLKPDLLFLDVQLPEYSAFDILDELSYLPLVIFITEYHPYALQIFRDCDIAHILKPASGETLEEALQQVMRIRRRLDAGLLLRLRQGVERRRYVNRFPALFQDQQLIVPAEQVYYLEARRDKTLVHTYQQNFYYDAPFTGLERVLDPALFVPVREDCIVAFSKILRISRHLRGDHSLLLKDKARTRLAVQNGFLPRLREKWPAV